MQASLENIPPACIRRIAHEIRKLTTTPADGVKLIPNECDITDIQALIEGPAGTPYEGGTFRVKLKLGPDFPQAPPKAFFLTKIFHPNVGKHGEICVNTLKKDWKEDLGVEHILLTIKCLLIAPNPESSLNEEAGRLLLEKYDDYAKHARLLTDIHARSGRAPQEEGTTTTTTTTSAAPPPPSTTSAVTAPEGAAVSASATGNSSQTKKKRASAARRGAPKEGGDKKTDQKKKSLKRL